MPIVLALFRLPHHAERAVLELSLNGFSEKDVSMVIFTALPSTKPGGYGLLHWLANGGLLGDTIDYSDGTSFMDGASVGAVIGGLLGFVYGTLWYYGPVAMGTAGILLGGLVGYLLDRLIHERRRDGASANGKGGLVMVQVAALVIARAEEARTLLKANKAMEVATLPRSHSAKS